MYLRPTEIFYSQDSIANTFGRSTRHRNVYIGDTLDELINGSATVKSIPAISVFWRDDKWFTQDNRRLWVFRTAEELRILTSIPVYETYGINSNKFTTYNGGSSVRVRGNTGGFVWRQLCTERSINQNENYGRTHNSMNDVKPSRSSPTLSDNSDTENSDEYYPGLPNYSTQVLIEKTESGSNGYIQDGRVDENLCFKCTCVLICIFIFLVLVILFYSTT
ncbi:unnamed protein product [Mytilus edulis]|uniref:Uncharacterized protein n=1 Tax=Mytilus edulis TaxID=6550 RepID=A0A8S3QXY8_MYTED|nr:unnamed protein product [Mytilus edulis]